MKIFGLSLLALASLAVAQEGPQGPQQPGFDQAPGPEGPGYDAPPQEGFYPQQEEGAPEDEASASQWGYGGYGRKFGGGWGYGVGYGGWGHPYGGYGGWGYGGRKIFVNKAFVKKNAFITGPKRGSFYYGGPWGGYW